MTTETKAPPSRLYECMFLLSQAEAANLNNAIEHIDEILSRAETEVLAMRKWDERRLAYEIDTQKRGVYILCYYRASGDAAGRIERECALSEHIMRVMIVRADHMSDDQARAADDRAGLVTEAKLRMEKAAAGEGEKKSTARLGAPEPEEMPQQQEASKAEAPVEETVEGEKAQVETPAEDKPEAEKSEGGE